MSSWLLLGLVSVFFLGLYDIAKKFSVTGNAVLPVLFLSTLFGALIAAIPLIITAVSPESARSWHLFVPSLSPETHLRIVLKSVIVSGCWIAGYFALKHLPISVASPIRASQPFWTVIGAVLIFHEAPTSLQWGGLLLILVSYFAFAVAGRKKGVPLNFNPWVLLMFLAALLGATSAFYDKILIQNIGIDPFAVQIWFAIYLVAVMGVVTLLFWLPQRAQSTPFTWRWSIPLIGVLLLASDFAYFHALSDKNALLSVLSSIRRSNAVISFAAGALIFHDGNIKNKILPLAGILGGLLILMF